MLKRNHLAEENIRYHIIYRYIFLRPGRPSATSETALLSYLFLVPHGSPPSHHDFAASFLLQLLCCHAPRSQNTTHEVELQNKKQKSVIISPTYRLISVTHASYSGLLKMPPVS